MSGLGFARPDLCSIRASADGQEEPAEAVRGGFSAAVDPPGGGGPPPLTGGIDRGIRRCRPCRGGHRGVCLLLARGGRYRLSV
jgi:hypothetical protein